MKEPDKVPGEKREMPRWQKILLVSAFPIFIVLLIVGLVISSLVKNC